MNPGPSTQPLLWDILIRSRMAPVSDVTKTFLRIELHEDDKDAFRFTYRLRNEPERKFRFLGFHNYQNFEKGRVRSLRLPKTKRMRIVKTAELEMKTNFIG